ncbi:MAG: hypothetical protein ACJ0FW_01065 [Gammaproteobacteria bacterium]|tara:strand:+ start:307 stop:537 length:231 start_codon:yes stop_codon:yes gene_type:complete
MEDFTGSTLIILTIIIFAVLNIILFFKIWGMTNNIKLITGLYINQKGIKEEQIRDEQGNFKGYGFVDKDGNQIKIR